MPKNSLRPKLLGIAGPSGSGKSWLAAWLREYVGGGAALLPVDDFYRDRSGLSLRRRERLNFDHPRAIDWGCLEQLLKQCLAGEERVVPCYDFRTHTRAAEGRAWRVEPLVIVEGLWVWWRAGLRRYFDCKIYIDAPAELCLERRLARDQEERGRSAESIRQQYMERVLPMGQRYVLPQAESADVVLAPPLEREQLLALGERVRALMDDGDGRRIRP